MADSSQQTIRDFGKQWKRYTKNEGYYASADLFKDYCGSLILAENIRGKRILEIGSGTGRIVNMLLELSASHVFAVEPSDAYSVLETNTSENREKVTCLNVSGEKIPDIQVDLAISFGVLHHIPNPQPVVDRVYQVLPSGGEFIVWLYGFEGNESYLAFFNPIRKITINLPDWLLGFLAEILNVFLTVYVWLCRYLKLPMKDYILHVFRKMDWHSRKLIIFDQLNPSYAKYYRKKEAEKLLRSSGFHDIQIYHRHGYSWTVLGKKG